MHMPQVLSLGLSVLLLSGKTVFAQPATAPAPRPAARTHDSVSLAVLEKQLKAQGWRLDNSPDPRGDLVVSTFLDPVTRKPLHRPATIRFSWVVAVGEVDITPGKEHREVYHLSGSPSRELLYLDVDDKAESFSVADRCVTGTTERDAVSTLAVKVKAPKDQELKIVLVQQRIEVIEAGKVTQVGYLNHQRLLQFRKQQAR